MLVIYSDLSQWSECLYFVIHKIHFACVFMGYNDITVFIWASLYIGFMHIPRTPDDSIFLCHAQRLKLNKIIDAAMRKYRSLYTYSTIRQDLKKHMEQCVCEKLSDLHTPDHPTYALVLYFFL